MTPCPAFFRLNDGKSPACGNAYCPYIYRDEVDCPIKPAKGTTMLRHEEEKENQYSLRREK